MICEIDGIEMNRITLLPDNTLLVQCIVCKTVQCVFPDDTKEAPQLKSETDLVMVLK